MTAEALSIPAGAASHRTVEWHTIHWHAAYKMVRRLQVRIVKAVRQGRWGKVKALQRLLTHSFYGKVLAIRRVTENQGKKTPGVDKVIWDTPQKKASGVSQLRHRGYHPQPLRRVYIPKSNGKKRPLGIPAMQDRAMQALYLLALQPIAETTGDPNSYGFREERSCADAMGQCFNVLSTQRAPQWVLEGDIKGCFDHISHEWLLDHIPMEKSMLMKWLKAGYIDRWVFYETEEGTPQGGIISPVLANLTLDGLETKLREKYPQSGVGSKKGNAAQVNLVRYADDFLITGRTKELLEKEVKPLVEQFMQERGLELSKEKTSITHIEDGFDFLGQNVRKYVEGPNRRKLLIKPSKKKVSQLLEKVRGIIKANKQATAYSLIIQLNPVIRGWANYHRYVVSKATYDRVDSAIFKCLWNWARRRHPHKGAGWVRKKYFQTQGQRSWIFYAEVPEPKGKKVTKRLYYASSTPIKRHTKIRSEANPYDPEWEIYFEQRAGVKMADHLKGRRRLSYLWKEQNGLCPVCQQKITTLTGWHQHHLVWKVMGGEDKAENCMLLHPECHRQLHSQKFCVNQPRPSRGVGKA